MECGGIGGIGRPYRKCQVTRMANQAMRGLRIRQTLLEMTAWIRQVKSDHWRRDTVRGRKRIAMTMA